MLLLMWGLTMSTCIAGKREKILLTPCSSNQSLPQVLNNYYSVTRDAWHHNDRHNLILEAIVTVTKALLSPTAILTTDLYSFPLHIVSTDLCPDLVWWDEVHKSLCLAGLIVCYETNFVEAVQRKSGRYLDILEQNQPRGYDATLFMIEIGCRGVLHLPGF